MPKDILSATAAAERMELYCVAKPQSPSAVYHPELSIRSGVWVALLGETVRDGIAGFGATIESALAAFDDQYLKATQPQKQESETHALSTIRLKNANDSGRQTPSAQRRLARLRRQARPLAYGFPLKNFLKD